MSFAEWMDNNTLVTGWLNRIWNETNSEVCKLNKKSNAYECQEIFYYNVSRGWIEMSAELAYPGGYLTRYPVLGKSGHLFEHVAHVSKKGKLSILSSGDYQVVKLLAFMPQTSTVFFIGNEPGFPRKRQMYKTVFNNRTMSYNVTCVTCGQCCVNNDASFSEDGSYYVWTCDGPSVPKTEIRRTIDHSTVMTWDDNSILKEKLSNITLPKIKLYRVHLSGSYYATVRLYLPPDLSEDGAKKVPLVIYVYGGPSEQIVTDDYEVGFSTYMSTARNVVYAKMDVRGGGNEGLNKTHEMQKRMGSVEIRDFIKVTK